MRKISLLFLFPAFLFALTNSERLDIVKEIRQEKDPQIQEAIKDWNQAFEGYKGFESRANLLYEVPSRYLVPKDFPIKKEAHLDAQKVTVYSPLEEGFRAGVEKAIDWAAEEFIAGVEHLGSASDWWWVLLEDNFVDNDGGGLLVNFNPDSIHYGKMAALWTTDETHFVVLEANYKTFYKELMAWNNPDDIFTCEFSREYGAGQAWERYDFARRLVDPRIQYPLAYVELRDERGKSHADMLIPKTMSRTFSLTSSGIEKNKTPHVLLGLVIDAKSNRDGSIKLVHGAAFEMIESRKKKSKLPFELKEEQLRPGKNDVARFELEYGYANMVSIWDDKQYAFFHPMWGQEKFEPTGNPLIENQWKPYDWEDCDLTRAHNPAVCPAIMEVQFVESQKPWKKKEENNFGDEKEIKNGINYASFLEFYPGADPVTFEEAKATMNQYVETWAGEKNISKRFLRKFRRDWSKKLDALAENSNIAFCDKRASIWNGYYRSSKRKSQRCYYIDLEASMVTLVQHGEG